MLQITLLALAAFILTSISWNVEAAPPSGETARNQLLETLHCEDCDLKGVDLSNQNLSGANLENANLTSANLDNTNLRGANLQGATMLDLNLSNTPLAGANLKNADLSDIDIDEMFEYVEIIGAQFEGARFKYGIICGPAPDKGGWGCQQR